MLEATYTKPYMAHASIGPSCAVAEFKDGKLTVWTHSQGVFPLRAELVKALKMPAAAIRCIHAEGSGCYGHNGADDVALDAALLARAVPGRPVRLQWMRDDEFEWEPYGPAMVMRAKAALGGDGRIVDWDYEVWSNSHTMRPERPTASTCWPAGISPSRRRWARRRARRSRPAAATATAIPLYDFPRQRMMHHFIQDMPIRVSALRTLGAYANVFALESFMDELAAAAGADPVAFRLAHLKDPRARAVIEAVAKKAGWKPGEKGDGTRGRGIGFAKYKNLACYVAVIAEVEVDRATGMVQRAAHLGGGRCRPDHQSRRADQPDRRRHHPVDELDAERAGAVRQERHPLARLGELSDPDHAGRAEGRDRADQPAERASARRRRRLAGPAVAAIANAFADATGKRIRDLPFNPERVKAALG